MPLWLVHLALYQVLKLCQMVTEKDLFVFISVLNGLLSKIKEKTFLKSDMAEFGIFELN